MNDQEWKALWQSAVEPMETSWAMQEKATALTRTKAKGLLASMKPMKLFALVSGTIWVVAGAVLLVYIYGYGFQAANKYFLYSATLQIVLTAIALALYLYQLIMLHRIDFDGPVLSMQEKLSRLRSTTLWIARILCLQLPLWTTFYWNKAMFLNGNLGLWTLQAFVTTGFTILALWLFRHIRYENRDRKWFRLFFGGKEWIPLMQAMGLLEQIEQYREAEA